MVMQIQHRRGTSAEHAVFIGAEGEITVNTENKSLVVHDGVLAGGHEAPTLTAMAAAIAAAVGNVDLSSKADQSSLDATDAAVGVNAGGLAAANIAISANSDAIAANASAIAAIDLSLLAPLTSLETLEAVVIEGLGAFATDIDANRAAIESLSGSPISAENNLITDTDLGTLTAYVPAFTGEADPSLTINCATGSQTFDLGAVA